MPTQYGILTDKGRFIGTADGILEFNVPLNTL